MILRGRRFSFAGDDGQQLASMAGPTQQKQANNASDSVVLKYRIGVRWTRGAFFFASATQLVSLAVSSPFFDVAHMSHVGRLKGTKWHTVCTIGYPKCTCRGHGAL